jgi:hypothetical protein
MKENKQSELEIKVLEYIYDKYSIFIDKEDKIRFGKAFFTVEMLCRGSIEVMKHNPDKDFKEIVDYMFDYYCT